MLADEASGPPEYPLRDREQNMFQEGLIPSSEQINTMYKHTGKMSFIGFRIYRITMS
jgi:hypothetical protein